MSKLVKNKNATPPRGWFDRSTLAAVFGVSVQHFDRTLRPLAPVDAVRQVNGRPFFHARRLLDAWLADRLDRVAVAAAVADADPDLAGNVEGSPALEEYRRARARLANLDVSDREGRTVRTAMVKPLIDRATATVRQAVFNVRRQFGNGPADVIAEALDELAASAEQIVNEVAAAVEARP